MVLVRGTSALVRAGDGRTRTAHHRPGREDAVRSGWWYAFWSGWGDTVRATW
ncbi:hypothetical protein [Streptomyces sp. 16-176A]|uniref:hypothetical protein n=1 Tax=Streptomyces sp. 16-176A TaxID=2530458 RepID=UPI00345CDF7A